MQGLGVGLGWNNSLICGNLSLSDTLQNQLNGVTDGFQTIMSQVIQNATSAVASLPALNIQRADPGLYNLLTNGILQARLDFDRSKATGRAMANKLADLAGGTLGWDQLAQGQALKTAVSNTQDAVAATEQAESQRGNAGVPWVGGDNAGGAGQSSIKVVGDVTRAGYNLLNGRAVTDTSSIDASTCGNRLHDLEFARCRGGLGDARARRTGGTHLRQLHRHSNHARRRPDATNPRGIRREAESAAGLDLGRQDHNAR